MDMGEQARSIRQNWADLRADSLRMTALSVAIPAYVWWAFLLEPTVVGRYHPPAAWLGCTVLTLAAGLAYFLRRQHFTLALAVLLGGMSTGLVCAMLGYRALDFAYLYTLPVIFASLLLGQVAVFVLAGMAMALILLANYAVSGGLSLSSELVLPLATITLVTPASWLSVRNLYNALVWAWQGYDDAHHNEQLAQQHRGELTRALKALDEATHRLERTGYMLTLARDQADEARRMKQQFAQNISHELRTPLNLIVGFTELMTESPEYYGTPLPTAYQRDLNIVHRNACHLQDLVNDVLDLARVGVAQVGLLPEETDIGRLVAEAVETGRPMVEAHGLALRTALDPGLPVLPVDPTRVRQVIFNLLNNATRFTERGSVTVSAHLADHEVVVGVADTGIGIPADQRDRIFDEFHQVDGGLRRRHEGAGLGLAISRRFVALHGGRIWVESELGQGSTFYFTLPYERPPVDDGQGMAQSDASPLPAQGDTEPVLLAVTRSPSGAALLACSMRDYRTAVAGDLEQAGAMAGQLMPQAVVIDQTCVRSGPERLAATALSWGLNHTPIVSCPLPGEDWLRRRLSVDGYLIKPVSRDSAWDVLRQFGEEVDRVLVIDDDRDFGLLMSRILEDNPVRPYHVSTAYSGGEGLALVKHQPPDLIMLDLELPDMDGSEVIRQLDSGSPGKHIPIVVVSGQDEAEAADVWPGYIAVTRGEGLMPGDTMQWLQRILSLFSAVE